MRAERCLHGQAVSAFAIGLSLAASCGGEPPTAADVREKFDSCGFISDGTLTIEEPESDDEKCEANCFLRASCDDLEMFYCSADEDEVMISRSMQLCFANCHGTVNCVLGQDALLGFALRCNALEECKDGSDEEGCPEPFKCDDGTELPPEAECDHEPDCLDGSDEADCPDFPKFKCDDGTEIPKEHECDLVANCEDGSDEHDACAQLMCK